MSVLKNFHKQLSANINPIIIEDITKIGFANHKNFPGNLIVEWEILAAVVLNSAIELYKNIPIEIELHGSIWQTLASSKLVIFPKIWKVQYK